MHQIKFSLLTLPISAKLNGHPKELWNLMCGANYINEDDNFVHYTSINKFKQKVLQHLDATTSIIGHYVTICKDVSTSCHKLTY